MRRELRRMSDTPTTATSQKSIAIHLQFVLQYASNLYCSAFGAAFGAPMLRGKGSTVSTPPICIAARLQLALQYASHSYCSTFGKSWWLWSLGCSPRTAREMSKTKIFGSVFGRTGFRGFLFIWTAGVFRGCLAGFFFSFLWENVPRKSSRKNPPAKSSKNYTTIIPDTVLQRGWATKSFSALSGVWGRR